MNVLVVSRAEVRRLLPMGVCIDLVAEALAALARGEALNPLRWAMHVPQVQGIVGLMPGYLGTPETLGLKAVAVFPGNHGTEYDSHQGFVLLFDTAHGTPLALVDASEITAIRTAAATAVATRLLAREDAGDLAILGSGVQARTHLEAMLLVRDIRRVRVHSPNVERCQAFARDQSGRHGVRIEAVESARAAVDGADLICTTTSAREPVLRGEWLASGAHVNAVGSSMASTRELDTRAVSRSRLYVDRIESAVHEAGDYLFPLQEEAIDRQHIVGEIGDILLGTLEGRRTPEEITLFKSLGLAVEDLAAAHHVFVAAQEQGQGTRVEL